MRAPPPVEFPLATGARLSAALWLWASLNGLALAWVAHACWLAGWWSTETVLLIVGSALALAAVLVVSWRRRARWAAQACLMFTGHDWQLKQAGERRSLRAVQLVLDAGFGVWLCLTPASGPATWVWLAASGQPAAWHGLRMALQHAGGDRFIPGSKSVGQNTRPEAAA